MDLFGSFALLLAFLCGIYAFGGGIAAIVTRRPLLIKSARNAGMAVCVLIWLGFGSLAYLFHTDNFSMAYVVEHSNRTLPAFFKFAAIWAGQEGSLLFWSFLLSIYVFSVLFAYRGKHPELMPYVGVVMVGVQLFFLTLNNFVASPFHILGSAAPNGAMQWIMRGDGNGLNPLLQYPEMVIHPPILYSGYTGFTIPFAFALGALLGRYPGEKWIHLTRRWTMIAWGFQGVGILLGAHWAYAVLGWGGYWMWDPVENASLMPWLTGTAFLHSVMMQEKRGMMRVWNVWLVFITFLLTIFGTMLTRSGVVNSVHAFAQSSIGPWFLGFIGLTLVVCFVSFWRNRDYLRSDNHARFAGLARIELPVQQSDPAGRLRGGDLRNACSRCSRNGCAAPRSASARRSLTRSICPSACSCCFLPAWDRCWPGARLPWPACARISAGRC